MDRKTVGMVLLVAGIILLVLGSNEYGAFGSRVARAFGSGPSNKVIILFISGGICSVLGLLQMLKK